MVTFFINFKRINLQYAAQGVIATNVQFLSCYTTSSLSYIKYITRINIFFNAGTIRFKYVWMTFTKNRK